MTGRPAATAPGGCPPACPDDLTCNGGPKCRHEHRLKQHPGWKAEQITPATFRWTVPSGRQYTTEPTRYPI